MQRRELFQLVCALLGCFLLLGLSARLVQHEHPDLRWRSSTSPDVEEAVAAVKNDPPSAPPALDAALFPLPEYRRLPPSPSCDSLHGAAFLTHLASRSAAYCVDGASSSFRCFQTNQTKPGRVDNFCIAHNAQWSPSSSAIHLDCPPAEWTKEEKPAFRPLGSLSRYWYKTGPQVIVDTAVRFEREPGHPHAPPPVSSPQTDDILVLIKREGSSNLWHCLMEIMSLSLTLDALRLASSPSPSSPSSPPNAPLYSLPADYRRTRLVLLDDHPPGPFLPLWQLFTPHPILRLADLKVSPPAAPQTLVVPLAGGANPLWQGDWTAHDCHDSATLRAFVRRVHRFAGVGVDGEEKPSPDAAAAQDARRAPLKVTIIDRPGTRKLVEQDALVAQLEQRLGGDPSRPVQIRVVDLAVLPLAEQIRRAYATDVLVGVHGAGLTHLLFMRPGGAVVEVLPSRLDFQGFRNAAHLTELRYYRLHAKVTPGDWHREPVGAVEAAVRGLFSAGLRSWDVD
ncbi:hypothetical protein JCM10207_005053 [Rhodosporidiobolus poonsookiae]